MEQAKQTMTLSNTQKLQDKRLFFLLNMARNHLFSYVDAECESLLGITVTQAGALLYIAKKEGCYQKELGDALGLKKSAVTGLVSRMEKNHLIERKPCAQDGRASTIFLTQTGKQKIPNIKPMIQHINTKFLADYSEDELATIYKFLNDLIETYGR